MTEFETDYLAHHGIKGQKWGVRRFQNPDGTRTEEGKKRYQVNDEQVKEQRKMDMKNRRNLSDADLRKRIERFKLEKELKSLTEDDLTPGKKMAKDILKQVGTKTIATVATGAVLYGAKAVISKNFNVQEFANAVYNGGPKKK